MSHDELIATLQFCVAVIRSRLVDRRYEDQRWFWELREKVALYALRSQLHDLSDLHVPPLSAEQRKQILRTHILLSPHQSTSGSFSGVEQERLKKSIRTKLDQSYLAGPRLPPMA